MGGGGIDDDRELAVRSESGTSKFWNLIFALMRRDYILVSYVFEVQLEELHAHAVIFSNSIICFLYTGVQWNMKSILQF